MSLFGKDKKKAEVEVYEDEAPRRKKIKVRAVKTGYYDHQRREPGDVFFIGSEQEFSDAYPEDVESFDKEGNITGSSPGYAGWMEKVEEEEYDEEPSRRKASRKSKPAPKSEEPPFESGNKDDSVI